MILSVVVGLVKYLTEVNILLLKLQTFFLRDFLRDFNIFNLNTMFIQL